MKDKKVLRVLPEEIWDEILKLSSQQQLITLAHVSRGINQLAVKHLYHGIIITDAYPCQWPGSIFKTVIVYKLSSHKLKSLNKIQLLTATLQRNPQLLTHLRSFICDNHKGNKELIELLNIIAQAPSLQRLEYPVSWFKYVTWNINSKIFAVSSIENLLTPTISDLDLSMYSNLKTLKVLEAPVSNNLRSCQITCSSLDIIRNLTSLAIEDTAFSVILAKAFSSLNCRLDNLKSFTYKIDCLSTPKKDKFKFEVLNEFLNFDLIRNFKLILWYTEDIEKYATEFLAKLNPKLTKVENFELKRNMLANTFETPEFNRVFTLTNVNYQNFFNRNLSSLKILQLSGNYLNKNYIIHYDDQDKNLLLKEFAKNFKPIFQSCTRLKVMIIDEFINIRNSSKMLKFLFNSCANEKLKLKISLIASYGYAQFFIDAFDDDFDENVDSTEYDLISYCLQLLRKNYIKFSSLDDPSYHFLTGSKNDFIHRINYIKSLYNNVDFHKHFHHKDKSWKLTHKCQCALNDYKLIIQLLVEVMSDYVSIIVRSMPQLELLILNGLFFKIEKDSNGKVSHQLLFDP